MKSIRSAIGASNLFYDKKELSVPVIPTEIVRGTLRTSVPVWEEQTVCQTSIVRPRGAAITGGAFAALPNGSCSSSSSFSFVQIMPWVA